MARVASGAIRARSRSGDLYRSGIIRGRFAIVLGWVALAVLLPVVLPLLISQGRAGGNDIGDLLPPNSDAVRVAQKSLTSFRIPVLSETAVVVHDPDGLSALTRADSVAWALSHTQSYAQGRTPSGRNHIVAAVPIPTANRTTAVTYLYVSSGTSLNNADKLARQYAAHFHNQSSVQTYVTGVTPAQVSQAHYLLSRLDLFGIASLVLIALIVGITFRSPFAPLAVLFVVGIGYLVAHPLLTLLAALFGFALPSQLEPLVVALLLGVVTDYCVLFFSTFRRHLADGTHRFAATDETLRGEAAVVAMAGLTVAGGTFALLAANLNLFRAFGPALALTVLIGLLVSLTLVPALMAILGDHLFHGLSARRDHPHMRPSSGPAMRALLKVIADRRSAALTFVAGVLVLVVAALPLLGMRLDLSFSSGLPRGDQVQRGASVLSGAGIRGVTAPTEVLLEAPDIDEDREALNRLQSAVEREPGVAQVLGPAQSPLPDNYGIVFARDGNIARLVVIFDSDPLGADAIRDLRALRDRLPGLAASVGLGSAAIEITGQTAIASELAVLTRANLRLTLLAVLVVELVLLMIYLGAVVAPLALLACSALGVAAALGLTTLFFQGIRGDSGLTFYAPFATAVLLLALGSDYNVFAVGAIWNESRRHPIRTALAIAVPRSSRAITVAGFILASTFAIVAVIPLETFRQIAFTMAVGLVIDTIIVRPILTPCLLSVLGRASGWPGRRTRLTESRALPVPAPVLASAALTRTQR